MNKDEIIEMAKQAGFDPHDMSADFTCNLDNIEAFAKLIAEKSPQRTWVGLTDDEVYKIAFALEGEHWRKISDAIEAKLKEKNT